MNKTFGEYVRELRTKKGMKAQDLAKALGISNVQLSYIENDKSRPRLYSLNKMAQILGVEFEELYSKIEGD